MRPALERVGGGWLSESQRRRRQCVIKAVLGTVFSMRHIISKARRLYELRSGVLDQLHAMIGTAGMYVLHYLSLR